MDNKFPPQPEIRRRAFLKCSAWAGAGVVWTMIGGVPKTSGLIGAADAAPAHGLSFAQISDTHIGFNKAANNDVTGTAEAAVARIAALRHKPAFLIHTGDLSHLGKPAQLDMAEQIVGRAGLDVHYVPGEHDILDPDTAKAWATRFNPRNKAQGWGWYSFSHGGVHFIGLVNVVERKTNGAGSLGPDQLAWLEKDLAQHGNSTPIVIFAHIPLFTVYADWGWATEDSPQLFALLRRFGSVTVLNGHIHQIVQKVEGNMTFHTARSTAYPQPQPGMAPTAGPMVVPAAQLRSMLGITDLNFRRGHEALALTDSTLA